MIWNPKYECMSRPEMETLQLARLQETVARCYHQVPFFHQRMEEAGVRPEHIKSLKDLRLLPFTTKADMRENYPFGLFAVPRKDVVRIHSSSGTTGKPTTVGYTRNDLEMWSEACARFITAAGVGADDIVQVSFGYGLFTGGFGLHYGLEKVGAAVVPASSGNTARQIMLMHDYGTTGLVCTPTYGMYLAESIIEAGLDPRKDLKLRYGLFGSEPYSEGMRQELESRLGLFVTDNYGLSEIVGPGVCGECEQRTGMHIAEDLFMVEVVDPKTLEPLPLGERGEIVITTLTKEATPMLRYRTRDISYLMEGPCKCGRTNRRLAKVTGRTDDMLIIRGVNVFPSQVESVLLEIEGTVPHYLIVVSRPGIMDQVEVWVEVSPTIFSDQMKGMRELEGRIHSRLRSVLGLDVKVKLVEPKTIERSEGKAHRVVDNRPKD